jgi:hypothetical protein
LEGVERDGIEPGSAAEARAEALRGRLAAAERLRTVGDDARDRLAVLEARLEEAVARAVELSVAAAPDARSLAGDVDAVVDELEAFRLALEEIEGLGGELGPGPAP